MFENNQEKVAEETSDISSQVDTSQVNANASASTAKNVAENKDYLSPNLFDDVKVIDKINVSFNEKEGFHEAKFTNLGIKKVPIDDSYVKRFPKLLVGGERRDTLFSVLFLFSYVSL